MAKRTKYSVFYHVDGVEALAKFSLHDEAMSFARSRTWAEVADKSGLVGQFHRGKATLEFAHLDRKAT